MKQLNRGGLSRRQFLKLAGITGAASTLPLPAWQVFAQDPQRGGVLIEARTYSVEDLDPKTSLNLEAGQITLPRFYEPLVTTGPTLNAVPKLATSWSQVDDTTWEFNLRQGVKFHNGEDFTAADVEYSYGIILDPDTAHPGINRIGQIDSIEIVDDYTVRFHLPAPNAIFPQMQDWAFILPTSSADMGDDWLLRNVNGTGPFRLESWRPQIEMVLGRHENYWQEGKPYLDGIVSQDFEEESSALAALRAGDAHFVTLEDPTNYALLVDNPDLQLLEVPANGGIFWCYNGDKPPMDDVLVRRAISSAINREEVLELVGAGLGSVSGVITPAFADLHVPASELPYYQYDPDLARSLLAEAGHPDGFAMTAVYIDSLPIMKNGALLFQQYMIDIGIDCEVVGYEGGAAWVDALTNEDFHFTTNLEIGGPTPESILNLLACSSPLAHTYYGPCSEELDAMVQAAAAITDPEERKAIWRDIQILVAEFQPTATWVYARNHVVAARNEVNGFVPFPDKAHRQLEDVWLSM